MGGGRGREVSLRKEGYKGVFRRSRREKGDGWITTNMEAANIEWKYKYLEISEEDKLR